MTTRNRLIAGTAALVCGVGGMTALWAEANRPATRQADITWTEQNLTSENHEPAEDEPGFNCWTMGNRECGTLAYITDDDANVAGAILPAANDGNVYVSWRDGLITEASQWQIDAGWETCIANAQGGDASMYACDDDYPGARPHMRNR